MPCAFMHIRWLMLLPFPSINAVITPSMTRCPRRLSSFSARTLFSSRRAWYIMRVYEPCDRRRYRHGFAECDADRVQVARARFRRYYFVGAYTIYQPSRYRRPLDAAGVLSRPHALRAHAGAHRSPLFCHYARHGDAPLIRERYRVRCLLFYACLIHASE